MNMTWNLSDIILLCVIAAAVVGAVCAIVRGRRKGGCAGCANYESCAGGDRAEGNRADGSITGCSGSSVGCGIGCGSCGSGNGGDVTGG